MTECRSVTEAVTLGLATRGCRTVMVVGPPGSGKSLEIERTLSETRRGVAYLATLPSGGRFDAVIAAHRRRRPKCWLTVELSGRIVDPETRARIASYAMQDGVVVCEGLYAHSLQVAEKELTSDECAAVEELALDIALGVLSLCSVGELLIVVSGRLPNPVRSLQQNLYHRVASRVDALLWRVADLRTRVGAEVLEEETNRLAETWNGARAESQRVRAPLPARVRPCLAQEDGGWQ